MVEPHARHWPRTARARAALATELRELGRACAPAATIRDFYFLRRLPVDVRHNAKIHRLALARRFAGTSPVRVP